MTEGKKISWTVLHENALQEVHKKLKAEGVVFERAGKPNASAIFLYLLNQELQRGKKGAK